MRPLLSCAVLLLASRGANAACVLSGARPTEALPTMAAGQEFSFLATRDCVSLRFTIPALAGKTPTLLGPVGMGLRAYSVALTESEWDFVVAGSGSTLTWTVTGRTSAGVITRLVTTNDLNVDEPITIDLSMADAQLNGFGYAATAGSSLSGAGDVDGDGHDDLLVGAPGSDDGGSETGSAYLILGPVTGTHDLSVAADATIVGVEKYDGAGRSVAGAGDMDGDGHGDLWVGAPSGGTGGVACLFLGPVTGTVDLSMADAALVSGEDGDAAGNGGVGGGGLSGAGDVDGDGHDDLLIGAYLSDDAGIDAGAVYLVLGPVTGTLDLSSVAAAKLVGEANGDHAGVSVSEVGDVNADGHDDLLVGAWGNDEGGTDAGAAYVLLGPVTGDDDLSVADAKLVGEDVDDAAGISVSCAGDVDGDGHDDLLIGANGDDGGGRNVGAAYLVLGPVTGTLDLSSADAKLVGEAMYDNAGRSVSGAGDVDGDGHDDLLVGALVDDEEGRDVGAAYLVIGPVTGTRDLSMADVKFVGKRQTEEADVVAGAGDVDGDGRDDLLIGAPHNGENGTFSGAAYLVYGGGL